MNSMQRLIKVPGLEADYAIEHLNSVFGRQNLIYGEQRAPSHEGKSFRKN